MPNPFRRALAKADTALDTKMGDAVRFTPMLQSDFGTMADPDRDELELVALVNYVDPSTADISKLDARVAYEETEIEIRRETLPAGVEFRKGDQVTLLDHPDLPRFKINRKDTNDPSRIVLNLSRIKGGSDEPGA